MKNSIFKTAMGSSFEALHPTLKKFHTRTGISFFEGTVSANPPESWLGLLLAKILGTPRTLILEKPLTFNLLAFDADETWIRNFPGKTMSSKMSLRNGVLIEKLGPCTVQFKLDEQNQALVMSITRMEVFGIPCPKICRPIVAATEHADEDYLYFDVSASYPLVGKVAHYRGKLKIE